MRRAGWRRMRVSNRLFPGGDGDNGNGVTGTNGGSWPRITRIARISMGGQQPECARRAFKMDSPRRPCIPRLRLHCSAPYGRQSARRQHRHRALRSGAYLTRELAPRIPRTTRISRGGQRLERECARIQDELSAPSAHSAAQSPPDLRQHPDLGPRTDLGRQPTSQTPSSTRRLRRLDARRPRCGRRRS